MTSGPWTDAADPTEALLRSIRQWGFSVEVTEDAETYAVSSPEVGKTVLHLPRELLVRHLTELDPRALKPTGELTDAERHGLAALYAEETLAKWYGDDQRLASWGLRESADGHVDWYSETVTHSDA